MEIIRRYFCISKTQSVKTRDTHQRVSALRHLLIIAMTINERRGFSGLMYCRSENEWGGGRTERERGGALCSHILTRFRICTDKMWMKMFFFLVLKITFYCKLSNTGGYEVETFLLRVFMYFHTYEQTMYCELMSILSSISVCPSIRMFVLFSHRRSGPRSLDLIPKLFPHWFNCHLFDRCTPWVRSHSSPSISCSLAYHLLVEMLCKFGGNLECNFFEPRSLCEECGLMKHTSSRMRTPVTCHQSYQSDDCLFRGLLEMQNVTLWFHVILGKWKRKEKRQNSGSGRTGTKTKKPERESASLLIKWDILYELIKALHII